MESDFKAPRNREGCLGRNEEKTKDAHAEQPNSLDSLGKLAIVGA